MFRVLLAVLLLAGAAQDGAIRELVRSLGAGDLAEREAAQQRLAQLGEPARPALDMGSRDADAEIALRSKALLRRLDLRRDFPDLPALLPGGVERLAGDAPAEWVRVFLEVGEKKTQSFAERRCLRLLAPHALKAASTSDQKRAICEILALSGQRGTLPEVLSLLRDEDASVRERAVNALGERAFEREAEITALLGDASPAARAGAVAALLRTFGVDALPLVLPRTRDPDAGVREALLGAIDSYHQQFEFGDSLRELIPLLKDPDENIRWKTVGEFEREVCREAIPDLIVCLKDVDYLIRRDAAYALGNAGAREAEPALERLLADPNEGVRQGAAMALGKLGARGSIPALLRLAGPAEKDVDTRAAALDALAELRAREGLEPARALLKDPDGDLQLAAAKVVWAIEGEAAAGELAALLRSGTEETREAVEEMLFEKASPRIGEALLPLLEDEDAGTRKRAVRILGEIRLESALPALVRRLGDTDPEIPAFLKHQRWTLSAPLEEELRKLLRNENAEIRGHAAEVLLDVAGRRVADELAPQLKPASLKPRQEAIEALGELRRTQDLPYLLLLLKDPSLGRVAGRAIALQAPRDAAPGLLAVLRIGPEPAQVRALDVLADFALPETEEAVAALLKSGNSSVRASALQVLVQIGARSRIPAILPLLDKAPYGNTIEALGALGAVDALPRLRRFLGDANEEVRGTAELAVARLGDRESIPYFVKLLEDPEPRRVDSASFVLGILGAREAVPRLERLALQDLEQRPGTLLQALARLGATGSARVFLPHLHEWGGLDRPEVAEALGMLEAREVVPELRARLKHRYALMRWGAATALGDMGAKEAVPELLPLLRDKTDWVVAAAADALGRLQAKEAIPMLREILRRPHRRVHATYFWEDVVDALIRLEAREAAPEFLEHLASPDSGRRLQALEALRQLRDPETLPRLKRLLLEKGERLAYLEARVPGEDRGKLPAYLFAQHLGAQRSPESYPMPRLLADLDARDSLPDLRRLLTSSSAEHRRAAADALCRFGSLEGVPLLLADAERGVRGTLFALNALRRPALWSRLHAARLPRIRSLSRGALWEELARALEVRLERSDRGWPGGYEDALDRGELRPLEGTCSLLDIAGWLLQGTRQVLILEDDRLRVAPEVEALPFWQAWWKELLAK